jgi:hypothetical protein
MFNSNDRDYLPEELVKIEYQLDHSCDLIRNRVANSFRFYDLEAMGIGPEGREFIELDEYLDLSSLPLVHKEFQENLENALPNSVHMIPFGLVPEEINNEKCLDSYLLNLNRYDPQKDSLSHTKNISNFHDLKQYYLGRFNLIKPWKKVIHFRKPRPFYEKALDTEWNPIVKHFPHTQQLIESLPFKYIGIALVFRANEDAPLIVHRDSYARNLKNHHINIAIDMNPRKVFIYDSVHKTKTYMKPGTMAYTFNETDLHGSEPGYDQLVLRVDGELEDWFADKIGLKNGITFDWSYDKPQNFIKNYGPIKIWQDTDI